MIEARKKFYLECLKSRILEKLKGDASLGMDFDGILEVYASSGAAISTLKRIYLMDRSNPEYFPSAATLHKLAKFVGFENWNEFVRKIYFENAMGNCA